VKKLMLVLTAISLLLVMLSAGPVFAGDKNQNGTNGKSYERGTGALHGPAGEHVDGCRAGGGDYFVVNPSPSPAPYWVGGPCCPSNVIDEASGYPELNQCCNPPDDIHTQPGNHCECFEMRE
jgi:hypothetical protein